MLHPTEILQQLKLGLAAIFYAILTTIPEVSTTLILFLTSLLHITEEVAKVIVLCSSILSSFLAILVMIYKVKGAKVEYKLKQLELNKNMNDHEKD